MGSNPTSSADRLSGNLLPFARVVLFMLSSAIVLAFIAPFARQSSGHTSEVFLGSVTSVATFALTLLFVRWERVRLADVGAMPDAKSLSRLAAGFLIGSLLITGWAAISIAADQVRWTRVNDVDVRSAAIALLAYLFLACREELAFRGFPLRTMHRGFGLWPAQVFIAVMFALEHKLAGADWSDAFLGAGVGSLAFGMAAIATRGLAVPIGMHAAWNVGHWALGLKGTPGLWRVVVDRPHQSRAGFVAIILYDAVMLSAAFAFWMWHRRSRCDVLQLD